MLDQIKVLDERNISFNIEDGMLRVYDQRDNLVGETQLPIPIEEGMDVETIYSVADEYGYNVSELLEQILTESVLQRREYDLWLTEENMIFYSPSAGQFVAEPYIGLFAAIGDYFENDGQEDEEHYEENHEEQEYTEEYEEDVEEQEEEYAENLEYQETEYIEEDEIVEEEPEEEYEEVEEFEEEELEEVVDEVEVVEETEEDEEVEEPKKNFKDAYRERFRLKKRKFHDEVEEYDNEEEVAEEPELVVEETKPAKKSKNTKKAKENKPAEPNRELIRDWKDSYIASVRDREEVQGVTLSALRDQVLEIILEKDKSVFEISENDILFELVERAPVVFDTKNAIKAGLYQAYLLQKDNE